MINWTDELDASDECSYNHVIGSSPFGRFLITWKGWKDYDHPTVDECPWDSYGMHESYGSVEEAKEECEKVYREKLGLALGQLKVSHDQVDILATEFNIRGGLCTNRVEVSGCTMARKGVAANLPSGVALQGSWGLQDGQVGVSCDVE